jgi:DNA-binding protein WhiA
MEPATVSFAVEAKEEIARQDWGDELKRSLLSSYIKINGHLRRSEGKDSLELSSENAQIAKALYSFIHELYGLPLRFAYTRGIGFHKRVKYHVIVDDPDDILGDLEVDFLEGKIPHNAVANDDLIAAYLAGGFLAAGSVNDPKSSNYHLEVALSDENYAKWFSHILNRVTSHQFTSKVAKRRRQYIVYLKRSDQISDFLVLVGAPDACLKFENVRVDRDFANIGNRLQNLDSANFGKTMAAAKRQKEEIEYFVGTIGWDRIDNPKLKALMKLRLAHEDATLDELSEMLSDELACSVSKSNINHLFRGLHQEYLKNHHGQ